MLVAAIILAAFLMALVLASCHTVQAVTEAPEEFWLTAEAILYAVWQDIMSLVDLLL